VKYIILGAGLSGLSCASALREAGNDVVIVEKEREVGGLARCFRADGFTFDYGPHLLFGDKVLPLLREIAPGLQLKGVERNLERIFLRGRFFKFPFDPKNLLLNMEGRYIPGALLDVFWKKMKKSHRQGGRPGDLESWVVDSVGKRVYDYIGLGEYVRKLYGLHPNCISEEWGFQKLKFMSRWRDVSLRKLATKALGEGERLRRIAVSYPSAGIDQIAKSLAERFTQMGGSVVLDAKAVAVSSPEKRVSVVSRIQGVEREIEGDFLISTIPVVNLARLIGFPQKGKVEENARTLRYRTLLLLFLYLNRSQGLDFLSLYFTEPSYMFRRITDFKKLSSQMAPRQRSSICVEMTCFEGDTMDRQEGEEILHAAVKQLHKGGFVDPDSIEGYHFLKIPHAYPVYEVGYENGLKGIFDELTRRANMLSIGRQGLFFYNTMSNSIIEGYRLGTKLSGSSGAARADIARNHYSERLQLYAS
jgi:protoporphyrinogen oxidase